MRCVCVGRGKIGVKIAGWEGRDEALIGGGAKIRAKTLFARIYVCIKVCVIKQLRLRVCTHREVKRPHNVHFYWAQL